MRITIAEPDKPIWEGDATEVVLPLSSGNVSVLDRHAPMVGLLREGSVIIKADKEVKISVKRGIVTVKNNQVDILVR